MRRSTSTCPAHLTCYSFPSLPVQLRSLDLSFSAPVFPLEDLDLRATVEQVQDGIALLALVAQKTDGTVTAKGQAQIALHQP